MPSGREVSRIEGFSDAVFGFALTLLVVSLEVPADYGALRSTLGSFLSFAVTFTVVIWIWYEHYLLFRRFGLEDGLTVFLNAVLLFLVLFFVYPLKFVFANVIPLVTGVGAPLPGTGFAGMTLSEARTLMMVYSGGFVTVFGVLGLLCLHAYRTRERIGLDALGVFDALAGARRHMLSVMIGCVSVLLAAVLPGRWFWMSGALYFSLGPAHAYFGWRSGTRREQLQAASAPAIPRAT
jgi:Endosomal/lysosomal potassium channel TMEM175